MKRPLVSTLALCLVAATGVASAQTYSRSYNGQPVYSQSGYNQAYPDRYGNNNGSQYDYARVIRVDPVFDSRYGSGYSTANTQRCYERPTYVSGRDGYNDGYYRNDGYNNGGYNNGGYGNNGYYDPYGNNRSQGSQAGATVATVIGGIVGAAIGSQVGGGSARYATGAIGSMVGGMAGRSIYEQNQRQRDRVGTVRVCDPQPVNGSYNSGGYYPSSERAVDAYDVTYEYAGRQYTTRTSYHPGDRIRVRVDVRPE